MLPDQQNLLFDVISLTLFAYTFSHKASEMRTKLTPVFNFSHTEALLQTLPASQWEFSGETFFSIPKGGFFSEKANAFIIFPKRQT